MLKYLRELRIQLKEFNIDYWKIKHLLQFQEIWESYKIVASLRYTMIRVSILLALVVISAIIAVSAFFADFSEIIFFLRKELEHISEGPFRGSTNLFWNQALSYITGVLYLILILYIVDSVHLSSHLIRKLAEHEVMRWPSALVKTYQNRYGLTDSRVIECRILLDFVKQHTDAPNKFIFYPFFVLFLIILSRNYYFDNWQTTPFTLFVYIGLTIFTLASAFRLRAAAQYAKEKILERLESNDAQAPVNQRWYQRDDRWYKRDDKAAKFKSLVSEIREFKEGIYKPLSHHPVVLYLLLPFSSLASVYLIEYLN